MAERVLGKAAAMDAVGHVTTGWTKFVNSPDEFESVRKDLGFALATAQSPCSVP